jgi:hypothetical protein
VHDEQVWSNTLIARHHERFFSPGEYLLGDSAFSNRIYLVPAFKKLGNQAELRKEQSRFNKCHSGVRLKSEHTIGIWKGRFPWLRTIPIRVTNRRSTRRLIRYVRATAILRNCFSQHNPPSSWIEPEDRDDRYLDELHYISADMTVAAGEQGNRRQEIFNYLSELDLF